jgi:hypothetical protein
MICHGNKSEHPVFRKKNKVNADKELSIYMRVTIDGQRFEISTNRYVEPSKWSGRQKRFTFEGDSFYVDLVFCNRLVRCYVLIELKIGKLSHQDIGQMQIYVNYYDRKIKLPEENPTIGIVLCKEENKTVVEFTLPEDNKTIFAKQYKLYLPSKVEL